MTRMVNKKTKLPTKHILSNIIYSYKVTPHKVGPLFVLTPKQSFGNKKNLFYLETLFQGIVNKIADLCYSQ